MIKRIACILLMTVLLTAVAACSSAKGKTVDVVCPEATMTLSDSGGDMQDAPSAISMHIHADAVAAEPATAGIDAATAQCRMQARTCGWQWQRVMREDAKYLLLSDNRTHPVRSTACAVSHSIDTQSRGYVYVIRHIVI